MLAEEPATGPWFLTLVDSEHRQGSQEIISLEKLNPLK